MRQMKFRVWDVKKNAWLDYRENYNANSFFISNAWTNTINWYRNEDDYVIQQFTGLLDKNDVEIYEGDIVKTCRGFILSVVFEYGAFILKNKQDTYSTLLGWQSDYESNEMDWTDLNDFEVIGNINKNPELLNNE